MKVFIIVITYVGISAMIDVVPTAGVEGIVLRHSCGRTMDDD